MIIKVKGYLTYRDVIGEREYKERNDLPLTLIDFISKISQDISGEHGKALFDQKTGEVGPFVAIMLNGRHYSHLPQKLSTILKDKDEIAIFPPGAGG
jgi:molybdopterin converting factor small subunit